MFAMGAMRGIIELSPDQWFGSYGHVGFGTRALGGYLVPFSCALGGEGYALSRSASSVQNIWSGPVVR